MIYHAAAVEESHPMIRFPWSGVVPPAGGDCPPVTVAGLSWDCDDAEYRTDATRGQVVDADLPWLGGVHPLGAAGPAPVAGASGSGAPGVAGLADHPRRRSPPRRAAPTSRRAPSSCRCGRSSKARIARPASAPGSSSATRATSSPTITSSAKRRCSRSDTGWSTAPPIAPKGRCNCSRSTRFTISRWSSRPIPRRWRAARRCASDRAPMCSRRASASTRSAIPSTSASR